MKSKMHLQKIYHPIQHYKISAISCRGPFSRGVMTVLNMQKNAD